MGRPWQYLPIKCKKYLNTIPIDNKFNILGFKSNKLCNKLDICVVLHSTYKGIAHSKYKTNKFNIKNSIKPNIFKTPGGSTSQQCIDSSPTDGLIELPTHNTDHCLHHLHYITPTNTSIVVQFHDNHTISAKPKHTWWDTSPIVIARNIANRFVDNHKSRSSIISDHTATLSRSSCKNTRWDLPPASKARHIANRLISENRNADLSHRTNISNKPCKFQ